MNINAIQSVLSTFFLFNELQYKDGQHFLEIKLFLNQSFFTSIKLYKENSLLLIRKYFDLFLICFEIWPPDPV